MSIDPEDADPGYGDAVNRQLEHEDDLAMNRLSWLVASQSFLFTGYAIILNGLPSARDAGPALRQAELLRIVPALGLATSGLIYLGLLAGLWVTVILRRELRALRHRTALARPPLPGTAGTHLAGLAPPLLLPPLFFAAWVILLAGR